MSTTSLLTDKLDEIASIKASIYSAILDKGGTFASGTDLSDYPAAIRTIGKEPNWILAVKRSTSSNPYTLTQSDLQDIVTLSGVSYGLRNMFFGKYLTSGCLNITEPFAVTQTECWQEAFMNSHGLGKVDLSGLTSITGSNALVNAFRGNTDITEVDMSGLTSVSYYGMYYAFYGCSRLAKVDLSSATYTTQSYSWYYTFNSCSNLTEMTVNPDALRNSSSDRNPCGSATYLTTLRFSQNAVRNVYITWQTRLTKDSITNILQHLGTPVDSNQSCNFASYSYEEEPDSELAAAYFEAIEKGWKINGLKVTVEDIEIITPANGILDLNSYGTITFNSRMPWTVSFDSQNLSVYPTSGQSGENTLSVSAVQGWTGDSTIKISTNYDNADILAYNYVIPAEYARCSYIQPGNNVRVELGNKINLDSIVHLDFMYININGGSFFGAPTGYNYYRFFEAVSAGNRVYYDMTGGDRISTTTDFGTLTRHKFELGNYYIKNLESGSVIASGSSSSGHYTTANIGLGGSTDIGRFYSVKIYNNGLESDPDFNYVPVVRISDSKYGMYDVINGIFYTANGTVTGG